MSDDRIVIREPRLDLGSNREVPRTMTGAQAYDWLAIHHPQTNANAVRTGNADAVDRPAAVVDGELEAIRTRGDRNGIPLVMKDLILENTSGGKSVMVPSPVQGYAEFRNDGTNAISLWSKPLGSPNNEMVGQVLHGARNSSPYRNGDFVPYGAPLVRQSDVGSPGAVHAHIEVEPEQFKRYLGDILSERINLVRRPDGVNAPAQAAPLADGALRQGENGPEVERLQRALNAANIRDAAGQPLNPDQDYGRRTREAVENYQRQNNQPVTGVADRQMLTALGVIAPTQANPQPTQQQPTQQQPVQPAAQTNPYGFGPDNELGRLIGRGEGGYNSYNRGVAGDARGAQIDFSQMTVGEIMRRQDLPAGDPNRLFAVGKYQFTPNTLEEAVNQNGIDRNARFTPQLQEKLFADYLIDEKRPAVRAYVTGEATGPQALERAQHALALEFASVGTPRNGGRGAYDGDSAGNQASITTRETATALNNMRDQYQRNVQSGMQPEQAYRALSGDPNNYTRDAGAVQRGGGVDDRELTHGERGDGVRRLQEALNGANIRDAAGKPLPTTGYYGDLTQAAVRQYQEREGLPVTGRAGPETLAALGIQPAQPMQQAPSQPQPTQQAPTQPQPAQPQPTQSTQDTPTQPQSTQQPPVQPTQQQPTQQQPTQPQPTQQQPTPPPSDSQPPTQPAPTQSERPLMSNPNHPDHRLYQQALSNLEQLGPSGGFQSREAMEKAAAAVAADAKASGLSDITHVSRTQGPNGQGFLVAVQGDPTNPASKNAYVDYNQAVNQTVEQSSRMAETNKPAQEQNPAQQQEQNRVAMGGR